MSGHVDIEWFDLVGESAADAVAAAVRDLPADELARAGRLKQPGHREQWLAGRVQVRRALSDRLGIAPARVPIVTRLGGKPAVDGDPLRFNLSHSGDVLLLAVSADREVGVDVERAEASRDLVALARRYFSDAEAAAIGTTADVPTSFFRAWTRKEAVAKCLGVGVFGGVMDRTLTLGANDISGRHVVLNDLDAPPGYLAAVAHEASGLEIPTA